jgi:hypothetical protein
MADTKFDHYVLFCTIIYIYTLSHIIIIYTVVMLDNITLFCMPPYPPNTTPVVAFFYVLYIISSRVKLIPTVLLCIRCCLLRANQYGCIHHLTVRLHIQTFYTQQVFACVYALRGEYPCTLFVYVISPL